MWNDRYRSSTHLYGEAPNTFLLEHLNALPMGDVLCLAEGEGRNAVFLAESGRQVTSIDISDVAVERAQRLAMARGVLVDAKVGDLRDFDIGENCWDGIVSIFAHMPTKIRIDLHSRVVRALRARGVLILEAYGQDQFGRDTGGPKLREMMMNLQDLRTEFGLLELIHAEECERVVYEGSAHHGIGAVVQIIARKL
jgi:SAM-dependent methyltransferase